MKFVAYSVALVLAASAVAADRDADRDKEQVRAKKPTVVTVEGKFDPVEPQRRSAGSKLAGGVKAGAVKVLHGLFDFTGWMLNVDQDIPSERDRRERGTSEEKR